MVKAEKKYTDALRRIVEKTDYVFTIKNLRMTGDFVDPWYDFESMKRAISNCPSEHKTVLLLLHMGVPANRAALEGEIGVQETALMIESGIWHGDGEAVCTNNYVLLLYQGLLLLTEINPWYETCTNRNTDVYIGYDSLRLAENIVFDRGSTALDLCSGTGIQGLLAAKSAKRVVSVELNEKAIPVNRFNILLNGMEDIMELRRGDLYSVLEEGETFDYIYANPPFIPMLDDVVYPICGTGGEDGLRVLGGIVDGLPKRLNPGGRCIIFCECLGDEKKIFFDKHVEKLGKAAGWDIVQLRAARLTTELQINKISQLNRLFSDDYDDEGFRAGMKKVYDRLGAKFLYSLVYNISACGNGGGNIKVIDFCSPWTPDDGAAAAEGIALGTNTASLAVMRGDKQIGSVNLETADVFRSLTEGRTVRETAHALYPKYKGKKRYERSGLPGFEEQILAVCLMLEKMGAINRKGNK